MTCLGAGDSDEGPGGIALLDHDTFDVVGPGRRTAARSTWPTTPGGT